MTKWELARYLMDAKKCVDSLVYVSQNYELLGHIDRRAYIRDKVKDFYLNCCYILDKLVPKTAAKRKLCDSDPVIDSIYGERDKNAGHKDSDYVDKNPDEFIARLDNMKVQLAHVRTLCVDLLPSCVTLDFVPHDRILYRLVHGITAAYNRELGDRERTICGVHLMDGGYGVKVGLFEDTEQFRTIDKEKCPTERIILTKRDGLTVYESLQECQDNLVKFNLLHESNLWLCLDREKIGLLEKLVSDGVIASLSWDSLESAPTELQPNLRVLASTVYREVV